jgi:acyl dehydratase
MSAAPDGQSARAGSIAGMKALVGAELGVSAWVAIDQERIARFAEATDDFSAVHLDRDQARKWGFEETFAQGFLTLSMLMKLQEDVILLPAGLKRGYNYGLERVRFLSPVMTGARIRGRFRLNALDEVRPGEWRRNVGVAIEIEGQDKPAMTAEWLALFVV